MLTATLLEPKVSLYQSYLGKAYYQLQRFREGLAALDSAKRLDPRDPTPWLYTSLFLRDQNRQVAALDALRESIARNGNRAVYRSRLLLDRDEATRSVSLAQLYRQLGFESWGAYEATKSLDADLTNASAHLFLAETYGGLPDRTQALEQRAAPVFPLFAGQPEHVQHVQRIHGAARSAAAAVLDRAGHRHRRLRDGRGHLAVGQRSLRALRVHPARSRRWRTSG